jgi:K+-sensing histidine kinase KdpD
MQRPEADTTTSSPTDLTHVQSEFLSGVSHQLRTPINAILGVTHLALAQADSEQQRQYLISIQTTSRQLMHSVNNLLDLSQLEQGTLALAPTNFQLKSLLDDLTQDVNTRLVKRPVVFTLTTDERIPATLNGDATRLKQLISCFIDNAIKFTQQGEIRLQVRMAARNRNSVRLHFTIEDTGSGLPPGLGMALFRNSEKMFEVGGSENQKKGVGLRIARLLAQLMSGDAGMITPHSPGAAFWFTVQLRPAHTAEQADTQHRPGQKTLPVRGDSDDQADIAEVLPPRRRPLPGASTSTSIELLLADLQQRLLLEDFSCLELARRHAVALENYLGADAIRLRSALYDFDFTRARVILGGTGET